MNSRRYGTQGETLAADYLQTKGYVILKRNFRSMRGEVDIICERAGTVVFVEVKRWNRGSPSTLEHAIGLRKQQKIVDAARYFLMKESGYREYRQRFDVVLFHETDRLIEHIEGAFESPWPG